MSTATTPNLEPAPDLFADAVAISANAYAVTLSFLLSQPSVGEQAAAPATVARLRLPHALARELAGALSQLERSGSGHSSLG